MRVANDRGPVRYVSQKAIDVRELAEHFGVDEDQMREFCIEHEREISESAYRSAVDLVEEVGAFEGLVPMTDVVPPEWDDDEDPELGFKLVPATVVT